MHWYAWPDKMAEVSQQALRLAKNNPEYVFEIRKKFEQLVPELTNFTSAVFQKSLSGLSNRQIWQIIERYLKLYNKIYSWAEPITLGLEDSLGDYLKSYLKGQADLGNQKFLNEDYNHLISPEEKSFVKRESDELLKIIINIQKDKNQVEFFSRQRITASDLKRCHPKLYYRLKNHEREYCWVPFDYGVYIWKMPYFLKVIKDMVKNGGLAVKLKKDAQYFNQLQAARRRLIKKYKIDDYHRKLFKVLRTCAYLLDYKKEEFTKSHYQIMPVFKEVAKRFGLTETQARFYAPAELKKALLNNQRLSKIKLQNRYKYSVEYWSKDKFKIYEGPAAQAIFKREAAPEAGKVDNLISLQGVIASAGKFSGPVRIIKNLADLAKFRQDEVLITSMTSPEYVPAMKKAGAIITDKGGVTCHAAVVSRELGVPCVVGTQNATKVFKTGELVEVNANHNSVKIIKK